MKRMELAHYKALVEGAKVLSQDAHGVKALETVEGNIVKLFRRKRTFSSAILYPYAARFARNARHLQRRGFRTVKVLGVYRIAALKRRDCVVYSKIPGWVVREKTEAQPEGLKASADLMLKISALMASMHREGFFFRSAHLGNLVVMPANWPLSTSPTSGGGPLVFCRWVGGCVTLDRYCAIPRTFRL